jgi:periplasmic copper chaperone A
MHYKTFTLLLGIFFSFTVFASDSELSIDDPYVRLVPAGIKTTGAFMVIRNAGAKDISLVEAESPVAQTVQLHTHINEDGVMKMRQVPSIDAKAKAQVELKPGSYHIMLIDLNKELKEGDLVPITLKFSDGQKRALEAPVRKLQMTMPMGKEMKPDEMKH